MPSIVLVRYTTRPDAAEENQRLVEQVYAELNETRPEGLQYATIRLSDGVTFMHLARREAPVNPLDSTAAFAEFQREIGARVVERPVVDNEVSLVGSYRLFD